MERALQYPNPNNYAIYLIALAEGGGLGSFRILKPSNKNMENHMNADQLKGKWKQLKGSVKTKWGKLTDDDLDVINGQRDQLIGRIQERYGIAKDEAQRQVDEWNEVSASDVEERRRAS